MPPFYLVQEEDGTSRIILEEGGGFLQLEDQSIYLDPQSGAYTIAGSPATLTYIRHYEFNAQPGSFAISGVATTFVVTGPIFDAASGHLTVSGYPVVFEYHFASGGAARSTQESIEALVQPTTQKARLSQESVEALVQPSNQKARLTQESIEALVQPTTAKVRSTAVPIEVLVKLENPDARVTSVAIEVLHRNLRESVSIWITD